MLRKNRIGLLFKIQAHFGRNPYLSLNASPLFSPKHDGRDLPESDRYTQTLLRLPLYMALKEEEVLGVCAQMDAFFKA